VVDEITRQHDRAHLEGRVGALLQQRSRNAPAEIPGRTREDDGDTLDVVAGDKVALSGVRAANLIVCRAARQRQSRPSGRRLCA